MGLLLDLLIAIGAGFLVDYIMARMSVRDPLKVILAVILGVVVFIAHLGSYVLSR